MWKKEGDLSYVGFTEDGAQWLVDNTDIKLVGKKSFPWQHRVTALSSNRHYLSG
jgi:hypothetical protein